ncbi:MAG TPA: FHA domain-containing protein [Bryobacteraceae bacterium]|nr:FHA domain-containing protein [Bryobacteraceae bacterium]
MSTGMDDGGKIRITAEDLDRIQPAAVEPAPGQARAYGSVNQPVLPVVEESRGSILMKAWFYLGAAGLLGALVAWGICEPWFHDGGRPTWANHILFPLMLVLMCVGFGTSESVVEHSPRKALIRGALSLGLGTVLGFVLFFIANFIFMIGLSILSQSGDISMRSPALWITRGIAWMGFGVAGGLVYGIVGQSTRKCLYGIAGGVLGAGLGGVIFDPIAIATGGAAASRGVGMALLGVATGVAMGLVEGALKDRWIYVAAGPLAGKQFILYKPLTIIGSDQSCDIYLFKDPAVMPRHAAIELRGARAVLRAFGTVAVQGRPVNEAVMLSGDSIQVGRYAFLYRDRERTSR